jgi:hypothetical protein
MSFRSPYGDYVSPYVLERRQPLTGVVNANPITMEGDVPFNRRFLMKETYAIDALRKVVYFQSQAILDANQDALRKNEYFANSCWTSRVMNDIRTQKTYVLAYLTTTPVDDVQLFRPLSMPAEMMKTIDDNVNDILNHSYTTTLIQCVWQHPNAHEVIVGPPRNDVVLGPDETVL